MQPMSIPFVEPAAVEAWDAMPAVRARLAS
jgi:hypothetical protein